MTDDPNRDLRAAIDRLTSTIDGLRAEWAEIYARKDVIEPQLDAVRREVAKHGDYLEWIVKIVLSTVVLALLGTVLVQNGVIRL